jgi:uncharacterized hydrophobic protein (TIGR00271 family)
VPTIAPDQVAYMRDAVFFDGPEAPRRLSRFWILLTLAAVIAATGVVSDSTATVIGAMIVAPLMIPIQGTMLASVIGERDNVIRSVALVVSAALAAIAIGFFIALLVPNDVTAATNSQVAARVNPTLLDLIAALATGAVASIALIRRDIADTLPGVAIAISLVPPLSVVGITLEASEGGQARGALLLFLTNVTAILAVGSIVMALFHVRAAWRPDPEVPAGQVPRRRRSPIVIGVMFVLVLVPLTTSSLLLVRQRDTEGEVRAVSTEWAEPYGWEVTAVATREARTVVSLAGPTPVPDPESLRAALVQGGIDVTTVEAEFVPTERVDFGEEP